MKEREEDKMATEQKELQKKLDSVLQMQEMAQRAMKEKGLAYSELSREVGIDRYEK